MQIGVRAATTAVSARSAASPLAVLPVTQPPQENPMTIDATAPIAIPCRRRVRDSPFRIEGTCMAWAFDVRDEPHASVRQRRQVLTALGRGYFLE